MDTRWFTRGGTVQEHMDEVARISNPAPNDWDGFNMWVSVPEKKNGQKKNYLLGRIGFKRCPGGWTETIEKLEPKPGMDYYMFKKELV